MERNCSDCFFYLNCVHIRREMYVMFRDHIKNPYSLEELMVLSIKEDELPKPQSRSLDELEELWRNLASKCKNWISKEEADLIIRQRE